MLSSVGRQVVSCSTKLTRASLSHIIVPPPTQSFTHFHHSLVYRPLAGCYVQTPRCLCCIDAQIILLWALTWEATQSQPDSYHCFILSLSLCLFLSLSLFMILYDCRFLKYGIKILHYVRDLVFLNLSLLLVLHYYIW
jgi:hypothetical protein